MVDTLVTELLGDSATRRAARRFAVREFRPARLPAACTVALVLMIIFGAVAVEEVAFESGHPLYRVTVAHLSRALHHTRWNAPWVLVVDALLVATGAALLLLAALPGSTRQEPLRTADPLLAAAVTRAGLCRALLFTAVGVPGIAYGSVHICRHFRRRVVVRVVTRYRNPGNLANLVRAAVLARLEETDPLQHRRVDVRLHAKREGGRLHMKNKAGRSRAEREGGRVRAEGEGGRLGAKGEGMRRRRRED